MNALVYVDIDQGIHKGKMKVALNEKRKKLHGFSFSINIANFEVFLSVFKLTKNLFFRKSVLVLRLICVSNSVLSLTVVFSAPFTSSGVRNVGANPRNYSSKIVWQRLCVYCRMTRCTKKIIAVKLIFIMILVNSFNEEKTL